MTYEQLPDEWKEWITLVPLERFRRSEALCAQYRAMGGSLDPDPDPTSPYSPARGAEEFGPGEDEVKGREQGAWLRKLMAA
jgi:hypothetical protein